MFRGHPENWFVINDGVAQPAIVLGISGKPQEVVHLDAAKALNVPLIRRFTGGGTVVVDENSIMTSFIMHGPTAAPEIPCYPRPIMAWSERILSPVMQKHGGFSLMEHGEVLGNKLPQVFGLQISLASLVVHVIVVQIMYLKVKNLVVMPKLYLVIVGFTTHHFYGIIIPN